MGGSGGGDFPRLSPEIASLIAKARSKEIDRLNGQVDEYIAEVLSAFNNRNTNLRTKRLEAIRSALNDVVDIEKVLLGGSVAKHTDVDGISDIDALVVIDRADLSGKPPADVRAAFYAELDARLNRNDVESVRAGKMAVTIVYRDGMEIQLLPATTRGNKVVVGQFDGRGWAEIDPRRFQTALTDANKKLKNSLVPAIKLMKSINADQPEQKRLKSYHIEALAVDAARSYSGPMVPRAVLIGVLSHSAERVLRPIADVTGQAGQADAYLGGPNSLQRRNAAQALAGVRRRLEAASSLAEWKSIIGG